MALFEHFPYVNIQNLNLNWIIKVLKDTVAELEVIQSNWEAIQKTANDAKTTADMAVTKSENARITANGAMTKAVSAEDTAKAAKTQAEDAELIAANTDSKVEALTTNVNAIGKTANDALSLAQTNESDITELQTRYKRTIGTRQVWTPAQSAYLLSADDFARGIYVMSIDYSEDTEALSFFDTIRSPFIAHDNLKCYLGSGPRVPVPAIVAQYPTSAITTAVIYAFLPKTQPSVQNGNRLYVQFETSTISRTIGLNT